MHAHNRCFLYLNLLFGASPANGPFGIAGTQQFHRLFRLLRKGRHLYRDSAPGHGTTLEITDQGKGQIPDEAFLPVLLRVWVGEQPSERQLKHGVLGG